MNVDRALEAAGRPVGVDWKPLDECCGPAGMSALMTDGERVGEGTIEFAGHYVWPHDTTPTHYVPLRNITLMQDNARLLVQAHSLALENMDLIEQLSKIGPEQ